MNNRNMYVPIIKGKRYDVEALGKVFDDVRGLIKPLVEAMPTERNEKIKKTTEHNVGMFVNYIDKYLPSSQMFVDFYGLLPDEKMKDGTSAIITGFSLLKKCGRVVTPTYGLDRDDNLWTQLRTVVSNFNQGFCFRISIDDLDDMAEETWGQIMERASDMGLSPPQVDIIIDLRCVGDKVENELKNTVIDFLALNPKAARYRSITVAGSSALKTVSEVIMKDGVGEVTRKELSIWAGLRRDVDEALNLSFGDYGIIHPDFSFAAPNPYINAKIRYTAGSRIIYFRGHGLRRPVNDYAQYRDLAAKVCVDHRYRGENASFGDKYIYECAHQPKEGGNFGNPSTWIRADMNHHISYTAQQTRRLIAAFSHTQSNKVAETALDAI
jgi:hypothetical protein